MLIRSLLNGCGHPEGRPFPDRQIAAENCFFFVSLSSYGVVNPATFVANLLAQEVSPLTADFAPACAVAFATLVAFVGCFCSLPRCAGEADFGSLPRLSSRRFLPRRLLSSRHRHHHRAQQAAFSGAAHFGAFDSVSSASSAGPFLAGRSQDFRHRVALGLAARHTRMEFVLDR